MLHYDDNFEPYWLDEKDWLVDDIRLPKDEDRSADLDYMGKLLAFSLITNTRMIAQIGDPNEEYPAYELWFSFTNPENERRFLDLVRKDGYADPDEAMTLKEPPALDDLPHLRPLSYVFPKETMEQITNIALTVQMLLGAAGQDSK
jgi:hypothetical protein